MLLLILSSTAYLTGMGGAISPMERPENIFINPASIGKKIVHITFYRPFNIDDFYKGDLYSSFILKGVNLGFGLNATRVNRGYTRVISAIGIKYGIFGVSLSQKYESAPGSKSFLLNYDWNAGIRFSLRGFAFALSRERLGFGFITSGGSLSFETTPDFKKFYAGVEFIVNRVISGSAGWMNGRPAIGLYLHNPRFDIEMGFLTNSELGETTIVSVGWRL